MCIIYRTIERFQDNKKVNEVQHYVISDTFIIIVGFRNVS